MPKQGATVRLTDRYLAALKTPTSGRHKVLNEIQRGLSFRLQTSGAASWNLRAMRSGQRVRVTLGSYPAVGIAEARAMARDTPSRIERGENPNEEKRTARQKAQTGGPAT